MAELALLRTIIIILNKDIIVKMAELTPLTTIILIHKLQIR